MNPGTAKYIAALIDAVVPGERDEAKLRRIRGGAGANGEWRIQNSKCRMD